MAIFNALSASMWNFDLVSENRISSLLSPTSCSHAAVALVGGSCPASMQANKSTGIVALLDVAPAQIVVL